MDIKKLTQEVLLKNMTPEQQLAVLESVTASVKEAKAVQKQKIAENVDLVLQALKRIEADMLKRVEGSAKVVEDRVKTIKDGKDGKNGLDGKPGKDGINGKDGKAGRDGRDGLNGKDGERGQDGVSVTNAHIDFDGSLIIQLSNGQDLNVGEVIPFDMAEKIRVIGNGGGTSQYVLDTLADLQTQINNFGGGLSYKGSWNASTNTPTLVSSTGTNGWYYVVSVAGSTNLNGVTDWQVGDWAIFNGSTWQKIDQTNTVTSVNGQVGAVSLTTTDVSEGTNQYFTNARARSVISAGTGISYSSSTGVVSSTITQYTDANAKAALSAGTGISYNSTTGVITNSSPDQTVALTAGTGISTTGTYPNFTITNTAPDQTVALTSGTGISVTGTYPNFTVTNTSPSSGGTVTSVAVSGGTTGLTTSGGPITGSGTITLAGTLAVANGGTGATTAAGALTNLGAYAASNPSGYTSNTGTVTSITAGTGLSGGTITTSGTVALANTAVTAGSYTLANITVDAQGRITTASNGSAVSSVNGKTGAVQSVITAGTAVASTSGTSIDFTGIPSWVKRVTIMFSGVSTNGASVPLIQLGAGSVTTSGYLGAGADIVGASAANFTTGFGTQTGGSASHVRHGSISIQNITGNTWEADGMIALSNGAQIYNTAGSIALSGTLDRVRITTVNGTDSFDAGTINIFYE